MICQSWSQLKSTVETSRLNIDINYTIYIINVKLPNLEPQPQGMGWGTRLFFQKPFFQIFVQDRSTNGLGAPGLHFFNLLLLS